MPSLEDYRSKDFVTYCRQELKAYADFYMGVEVAALCTPDGFEVASYFCQKKYAKDNLAAVCSSIFALGSSLFDELDLKACKSVILDGEKNKILLSSIPSQNCPMILLVQASDRATLGNVIHGTKKLSENIAQSTIKKSQ